MKMLLQLFPVAADIINMYQDLRFKGKGRDEAVAFIKRLYANELQDTDDGLPVLCGLVLALSSKRELTDSIASKAKRSLYDYRLSRKEEISAIAPALNEFERILSDNSLLGNEAIYKKKKLFVPDWKIGDVFTHSLCSPKAHELGIQGWLVLVCKVGEFVDDRSRCRQLVYVSVCSKEAAPKTTEELQKLGFLRVMPATDTKWDYLMQVSFRNKSEEISYAFEKLGNFPGITPPEDASQENPLVAMPMLGHASKTNPGLGYEAQVCLLYKRHREREKLNT